jgi:methionyl aminopeptidase
LGDHVFVHAQGSGVAPVVKSAVEIELMRKAGQILAKTHAIVGQMVEPGVSLLELDAAAEHVIRSEGATPSFKGFHGFPGTICTALNSEVVHGIPDQRKLQAGDIITIDSGACWRCHHSDAARTYIVGGEATHPERAKFSKTMYAALMAGINKAHAGNRVGDISAAVQAVIDASPYSLVREYGGHGLGKDLHEEPYIANYGKAEAGILLKTGMVLAIEPIVAMGSPNTQVLGDNWTVVTLDGSDAGQWEHFGVVQEDHFEILC